MIVFPTPTDNVQQEILNDMVAERRRQDDKWSPQRNLDDKLWATILGEEFGESCKAVLENSNLRDELVQVAAVALAWIEDIDTRTKDPK